MQNAAFKKGVIDASVTQITHDTVCDCELETWDAWYMTTTRTTVA